MANFLAHESAVAFGVLATHLAILESANASFTGGGVTGGGAGELLTLLGGVEGVVLLLIVRVLAPEAYQRSCSCWEASGLLESVKQDSRVDIDWIW